MKTSLITPPNYEPISIPEIEKFLRITNTDERNDLGRFLLTAVEHAEKLHLRRALMTQVWELYLDEFPAKEFIEIPKPPLQSVASIKYKNSSGVETTWAISNYIVDTKDTPGRIYLADGISWPSEPLYPVNAITIRFTCGYSSLENIPQCIRQGLAYHVGLMNERRDVEITEGEIKTLKNIYSPYAIARRW